MRNFRAELDLNMCRVVTGKHLCRGLLLNNIADWRPATIFKWNSDTGTFLWLLLNFTQHLFEEQLGNAVPVVFSQVLLFSVWRVARQWRPAIRYVNVNQFKKNTAKFHVIWRGIYFHEKQQLPVFCLAKYSSSCIVFIVFSA